MQHQVPQKPIWLKAQASRILLPARCLLTSPQRTVPQPAEKLALPFSRLSAQQCDKLTHTAVLVEAQRNVSIPETNHDMMVCANHGVSVGTPLLTSPLARGIFSVSLSTLPYMTRTEAPPKYSTTFFFFFFTHIPWSARTWDSAHTLTKAAALAELYSVSQTAAEREVSKHLTLR